MNFHLVFERAVGAAVQEAGIGLPLGELLHPLVGDPLVTVEDGATDVEVASVVPKINRGIIKLIYFKFCLDIVLSTRNT